MSTVRRVVRPAASSLLYLILSCAACNRSAPSSSPASADRSAGSAAAPATTSNREAPDRPAPAAAPTEDPSAAAHGQSAECTLQTPLTPGVPGSPGHLIPSARNPNGQSELAALMRSMEAALKEARPLVAQGQKVGPFASRFAKIRCAWPTNLGDRDAQFDALAVAYLSAVARLDATHGADAPAAFDGVLNACRACHERACSGAIVAINALRLPSTAAVDDTKKTGAASSASPPPSR